MEVGYLSKGLPLKVFSVIDNPPIKKTSSKRGGRLKAAKKKKAEFQRENLTADQIRAKVKKNTIQAVDAKKLTRARMDKFKANKLPDIDEAQKAIFGEKEANSDVGTNDPNDPATHGKLKSALAMSSFNFSDKEKATLEKILID